MYERETEQLQKIIDDSSRIVFSAEPAFRRRAGSRISAVRTGSTIRSINIRRSR